MKPGQVEKRLDVRAIALAGDHVAGVTRSLEIRSESPCPVGPKR